MGNLFGSPEPPPKIHYNPPPAREYFNTVNHGSGVQRSFERSLRDDYYPRRTLESPRYLYNAEDFVSDFQRLSLNDGYRQQRTTQVRRLDSRCKTEDKLITRNNIVDELSFSIPQTLGDITSDYLCEIPLYSWEHSIVNQQFKSSNKKFYKITKIKQVNNKYLHLQFCLKYTQMGTPKIKEVFHGTRLSNISSICKNNFNWRLHGQSRGHKFGHGVSFSPISYYASHYSDKSFEKVMILAQILVNKSHVGNSNLNIPLDGYDTTTSDNEQVLVKYDDFTFYPKYLIYYEGHDHSITTQRRRK